MVFFLVSDACYDKNDYRYNVRKHFDKRFLRGGDAGNVVAYLVERAENERTEDCEVGLPQREDNQRDGKPADGVDGVFPVAAEVIHDIAETAETCNAAAENRCNVAVFGNAYACCVRSCGVFSDRAQVKSRSRLFKNERADKSDNNGKIDHCAVGEYEFAECAEFVCKREICREEFACGRKTGSFDKRDHKVGNADAERGENKTRNVLICAQRNRKEAVDKSHKTAADECCEYGQQHRKKRVRRIYAADACYIYRLRAAAECRAYAHRSGNAEVKVSRFFGQYFAC